MTDSHTPALDRLARDGVHFKNAFVTTALCSPSRASILTGLYAHQHHVVDNNHPIDPSLTFFPQYLQQAGYETAFIGKWHMGGDVAGGLRAALARSEICRAPVLYVCVAQGRAFGVHPGRASQRALRQRTLRTAGNMERDAGQGRTAADVDAKPAQ